jgi:hypothetical protein
MSSSSSIGGADPAPRSGEPPREVNLSASERREFRRQLEAVTAIEDKRMRNLIVELLKLLSEASGPLPLRPVPVDVPAEP